MSNPSQAKAIWETNLGLRVEKEIAMLADANIFTTYGRCRVNLILGTVTTEADGGATTIKLRTETGTLDICAATTVTGDVVGTMYFVTGEKAVILNGTGNVPVVDLATNLTGMPSSPINLGRIDTLDAIEFVQTGDDADLDINWILFYVPLDPGAYIEAA